MKKYRTGKKAKLTKKDYKIIEEIELLLIKSTGCAHEEERKEYRDSFFKAVQKYPRLAEYAHGAGETRHRNRILNLLRQIEHISGHTSYAQDRGAMFDISKMLIRAVEEDMSVEVLKKFEITANSMRRRAESWRDLAAWRLHKIKSLAQNKQEQEYGQR